MSQPACRVCATAVVLNAETGNWECPIHGATIPVYPPQRPLPELPALPAPPSLRKVA